MAPALSATHQQVAASQRDCLERALKQAAELLPAQGPLDVFVHHNTLHALEHMRFHDAVRHAARLYGCEPYLRKDCYRDALACGRIRDRDLVCVLREELGGTADTVVLSRTTRLDLRLAMLRYPVRTAPAAELRWFAADTDAIERFRRDVPPEARRRLVEDTRAWVEQVSHRPRQVKVRKDAKRRKRSSRGAWPNVKAVSALLVDYRERFGPSASWDGLVWERFTLRSLWAVCRAGVRLAAFKGPRSPARLRHRDVLLEATGEDSDALVHPVLIRFCAAFLDQGLAQWPLPHREAGLLGSFCRLYGRRGGPPEAWMRGLATTLRRLDRADADAADVVLESLELLGVPPLEWEAFLAATLFVLRGWAGMIYQLEVRGDRAVVPAPEGSLLAFLAVRLLLERFALAHVGRRALGYDGPLKRLRGAARLACRQGLTQAPDERAFTLFQVAQLMGWSAGELSRLTHEGWTSLEKEIEGFPELERRRVFHLAYERRIRVRTLDALSAHGGSCGDESASPPPCAARFQAIFCIDEREESMRRHLEEAAPDVETFGTAGSFGVAMYYRGAADAHAVPLCPVAVKPEHYVAEEVVDAWRFVHRRRMGVRRALGRAMHRLHVGSRRGASGALVTSLLGVFASLPLVARVLFPRATALLRRRAGQLIATERTRLRLERAPEAPPDESSDGPSHGFAVVEMAGIVERVLRDIGLSRGFSRLVFVVGHGSSSLNNPHESAHDCGACGGGRGGPNARAFAQMANDARVRWHLEERGITIPLDTRFVGTYHNSCDDSMAFFDMHPLPETHADEFRQAKRAIEEACSRNAHERCRRFESAPLDLSPEGARRHVEARAEDLAQTRPEFGHATNAVCVVGRRRRTRGLFLDRRAFLVSYDPTQDDAAGTVLARTLEAIGPVCAGISLEYYFSTVDPSGYGCGTKLPHNIAALLGVMDGHASDLRTGLPWQMVEIHEPVRLLLVVESRPEVVTGILARRRTLGRLCENDWIQLATLDPGSSKIFVYEAGLYVPYEPESRALPVAAASAEWYRGRRDHLDFARIEALPNGWRDVPEKRTS